jgi:hypothetical protein
MGWTYGLIGAATILAVQYSARIYDFTHGYHLAFVGLFAICLVLIAISAVVDLRVPKKL